MSQNGTGVAQLEDPAQTAMAMPPVEKRRTRDGVASILRDIAPVGLVLVLIGAVGWWGHRSGWKMPKFAELTGQVAKNEDWCSEHGVPESECVECLPDLLPKGKAHGLCKIHRIPVCTLCNPELAQLATIPRILPADLELARRALDVDFTTRPENNDICRTHQRRIQFATHHDAEKSGIDTLPVRKSPAIEFVAAPGEIGYDQTRVAHLSSRAPGSVWRVCKHIGEATAPGDVLALIDAADVGKAKTEVLQAFTNLQLKALTLASIKNLTGTVPEARMREADAAVREAQIRLNAARQALVNLGLDLEPFDDPTLTPNQLEGKLHFLGIPPEVARPLDARKTTTNLLPLFAPMQGRIVSREVVAGEVVDVSRILFEVVDTSRLWLTFDLKGEDARRVKIGQTVRFRPDASPEELTGQLAWISTQADPKTRTVKVRADLEDPEGRQHANTFGAGKVILRQEDQVVSVPNESVQWEGCCNIVFVRDKDYLKEGSPKVFHVRKVRIGAKSETITEIIAGVLPNEIVVTKGSGLLLTELLRGSLGEGCACHSKK